ncbi:hypothetical protein [Ilumatobacter coccineus]|uniref:Uncharacterized protein n=1 Tax=Ilumatobacter coccineus (strain NBRC 103263 / KCTC 29153 / YM16-304) TaxID=1313172 RepID=A0A6C7EA35_ILUCY|nr:hypothetical protein [Ilumatobacter coccineus]BAN03587.1 hypothetical protein YM304_32730 [Ilumatobacter coccineus YM16-304]
MTIAWYRAITRLVGFATCALVVLIAAQWLSLSFGWKPVVDTDTVATRTDRFRSTLREGPAILIAVTLIIGGVVLFVAWLLAGRRTRDDGTFRVGTRQRRLRIDRNTLAASIERHLEPIDRRVDATVSVTRRGQVDLRLVTPDTSATGTVSEHTAAVTGLLSERSLPCTLRSVDVIDVRKLKSRHRAR